MLTLLKDREKWFGFNFWTKRRMSLAQGDHHENRNVWQAFEGLGMEKGGGLVENP